MHVRKRGDVKELLAVSIMLGSSPANPGKMVGGDTNIIICI